MDLLSIAVTVVARRGVCKPLPEVAFGHARHDLAFPSKPTWNTAIDRGNNGERGEDERWRRFRLTGLPVARAWRIWTGAAVDLQVRVPGVAEQSSSSLLQSTQCNSIQFNSV